MNRFNKLFTTKQSIFMPFFMLGYPSLDKSFELIKTAIDAGCDAVELGIPFSDPVADGPVIEASGREALKNGANFQACCQLIRKIRDYSEVPIGLLVYYNLLFQQGGIVYQTLQTSGIDAVLVVDLPIEESESHEEKLTKHHIGCVQLIAPNSDDARAKKLLDRCTAFAYVVSRYGTTGVSQALSESLAPRLQALKKISDCPLVVGFGISTAEQVKAVLDLGANGAIIGSHLTKMIAGHEFETAKKMIFDLVRRCKE